MSTRAHRVARNGLQFNLKCARWRKVRGLGGVAKELARFWRKNGLERLLVNLTHPSSISFPSFDHRPQECVRLNRRCSKCYGGNDFERDGGNDFDPEGQPEISRGRKPPDQLRDLKSVSSRWMHEQIGEHDATWQDGYGALTVGAPQLESVSDYILRQEEHHRKKTFQEEYLEFLKRGLVEYDEQYLW